MKYYWILLIVFCYSDSTFALNQECNDCVQVGSNTGTINIEGRNLIIGINKGKINIIGSPADKQAIKNYDKKIQNLSDNINSHLLTINKQKRTLLLDSEKIHKASQYAESLLRQIASLDKHIARLDKQHRLTQEIISAKEKLDVALIKSLLKQKQKLDDWNAAETAFELAGFQKLDLEYEDSISNYNKAVSLDPNNTLYLSDAAKLYNYLCIYDQALELATKALSIDSKKKEKDIDKIADGMRDLGSIFQNKKMLEKAFKYYDDALILAGKNPGAVQVAVLLAIFNDRSTALLDMGKYSQAIKGLKATHKYSLELYGEDSQMTIGLLQNIGTAYLTIGNTVEAIRYLEYTLRKRIEKGDRFRQEDIKLRSYLASAYRQQKKYDIALKFLHEAVVEGMKIFVKEHPIILTIRHKIALIHQDKKEHSVAIDVLVLVAQDRLKVISEDSLDIAKLYADLAYSVDMIGRTCDAIMLYKKAYSFYLNEYGNKNHNVDVLRKNIDILKDSLLKNSEKPQCSS